jgi:hypothetical protein
MSITTSSGQTIVDFRVSSVHGTPAIGAYLLKFSLAYEMPPHEAEVAYFHNTSANVYVGPKCIFLGRATPEMPKTYKPNKHPQNSGILYELLVSKISMDEIEQIRMGGDLDFKLDITGEYYDGYNQLCNRVSVTFKENPKSWIETLKRMEYKGGIVFELPMPIDPDADIEAALSAIEKAKEHLYYGNYDDVIAKCRISLESIISSWGDISSVRKVAMDKASRKSMSKEQRFFNAIDQIVHFANLAHHPNTENEYVSFTRSEAVFILGTTISAISSFAEDKVRRQHVVV